MVLEENKDDILWEETSEIFDVGEGGAYEVHDPEGYVSAVPAAEFEGEWQRTALPGQWASKDIVTAIQVTRDFELVVGEHEGTRMSWSVDKGDFVLRYADGRYGSLGPSGFGTRVDVLEAPKP